jgi:hypothetical protein
MHFVINNENGELLVQDDVRANGENELLESLMAHN